MTTVSKSEFVLNANKYLYGVVAEEDFIRIPTTNGAAVVISEVQWDCLMELLHLKIRTKPGEYPK